MIHGPLPLPIGPTTSHQHSRSRRGFSLEWKEATGWTGSPGGAVAASNYVAEVAETVIMMMIIIMRIMLVINNQLYLKISIIFSLFSNWNNRLEYYIYLEKGDLIFTIRKEVLKQSILPLLITKTGYWVYIKAFGFFFKNDSQNFPVHNNCFFFSFPSLISHTHKCEWFWYLG